MTMNFRWRGDEVDLTATKPEQGASVVPYVEDGKPFALVELEDGTEILLNKEDVYRIAGAYSYAERRKKRSS